MSLYSATFYTSDLDYLFSDMRYIEFMLKAESALIEAQAVHGLVPVSASHQIQVVCDRIENIDVEKIKKEIKLSGNAAIPLVKQITDKVKQTDPEASKYVHLGATSQDIVDTATCLLYTS